MEVIGDVNVLMCELLQSITTGNQVFHKGFDSPAHFGAADWNQIMIQQMLAHIFYLVKAYVMCVL